MEKGVFKNIGLLLRDGKIISCSIHPNKYLDYMREILIDLIRNKINIIYICTSKPYSYINSLFDNSGIKTNNIFFIDCVSKSIGANVKEETKVYYLDSPQAVTTLGLTINEILREFKDEKKVIIFDELSTFFMYNGEDNGMRFVTKFINDLRHSKSGGLVIYYLKGIKSSIKASLEGSVDESRSLE